MGLGQEKLHRVSPGCSGGESLHEGKHFGAAFPEELQKLQVFSSYGMLFGSGIWETYCSYLLIWPAGSWLPSWTWGHDMQVWNTVIAFGDLHHVATISPELLTVCHWYSKFQVTFSNINWHWECSRRTKTFLHLKMQHTWPWHKQSFARCCDIFNLQFQSSKNYVLRCWKP